MLNEQLRHVPFTKKLQKENHSLGVNVRYCFLILQTQNLPVHEMFLCLEDEQLFI